MGLLLGVAPGKQCLGHEWRVVEVAFLAAQDVLFPGSQSQISPCGSYFFLTEPWLSNSNPQK